MPNDRKQFAIEKIEKQFDKLDISECIEIWKTIGEKLHQRVVKQGEESQQKTQELLKSLNKSE